MQQLAQVGCRGYLRLAQNTRVEIRCFITQSTVTTEATREATRSFDFVYVMCIFSFSCFGFSFFAFRDRVWDLRIQFSVFIDLDFVFVCFMFHFVFSFLLS